LLKSMHELMEEEWIALCARLEVDDQALGVRARQRVAVLHQLLDSFVVERPQLEPHGIGLAHEGRV